MRYETSDAFRQALEERLRQRERETTEPLVRVRKRLIFERCMARLQKNVQSPWIVKGGFALELRLGLRARMTRDLDLGMDLGYFGGMTLTAAEVARQLRQDLHEEEEDGFVFVVSEGVELQHLPSVRVYRFTVEARLAGRRFETIRVDVGVGDPLIPPYDELAGSDLLAFAGIPPATIRATSRAQHLAEKVHALTRPHEESLNSRVKDLADILLLMNLGLPEHTVVQDAVRQIFQARQSHAIPTQIAAPPVTWTSSFAVMAKDLQIAETSPESATARLNEYWTKLFS